MRHSENKRQITPPLSCIKVQPIFLDTSKIPPPELTALEKAQRQFFEWFETKEPIHDIIDDFYFAWMQRMDGWDGIYSSDYRDDVLHVFNSLQKLVRLLDPTPHLTRQEKMNAIPTNSQNPKK